MRPSPARPALQQILRAAGGKGVDIGFEHLRQVFDGFRRRPCHMRGNDQIGQLREQRVAF